MWEELTVNHTQLKMPSGDISAAVAVKCVLPTRISSPRKITIHLWELYYFMLSLYTTSKAVHDTLKQKKKSVFQGIFNLNVVLFVFLEEELL